MPQQLFDTWFWKAPWDLFSSAPYALVPVLLLVLAICWWALGTDWWLKGMIDNKKIRSLKTKLEEMEVDRDAAR